MKRPDKQRWCVFLVICLLGVAYVGITLARIEAHISDAVTDSVKLGLIVILCLTGYLYGRDYFRFTRTAPVFVIAMSFLILYHLIELTEEFVIFRSVPIIGEGSLLKRVVETILMIGSICLFLGGNYLSVRDINQARQQLESHARDLSESREKYRHLMTHNVAGIWRNEMRHPMPLDLPIEEQVEWLMDQDILVEVNGVIVKMYGFDCPEQVLGKTNRELFAHDLPDVRRALRVWIEQGFRFDGYEMQQHISTGEYRWFLMMGHGIIEDRHLIGSWGTAIDITEQKTTRLTLEAEKRFTEKAINAQIDTFFVFNPETGKPVVWNKSFVEISGYSDEEIMAMEAPGAWYHKKDLEKAAAAIGQIGEKGYSTVGLSLQTKSGKAIPFEYRSSMIKAEGGETLIIAIGRDISERKQAEEALRESEQRARALLNATTDSVLFLDGKGCIIDLNNEMARRLGKSRDAMIGSVIYDYLPPDIAAQRKAHGIQAERTRKPVCFEDQRAGRWLENNVYPVHDAQGEVVRFAVYSRDITDRKQAEEALHRERRLNEELFKTTPAFAVAINAEGKTVMMNDAMCHALGYTFDEVNGADYLATFIPEREREKLAGVLETLNSTRESTVSENALLTRDGRELLVEWQGSQVFNTQGEFEFLFGVGIDITERRRVEQALHESEQRYRTLYTSTSEGLALYEIIYDESGQALDYKIVDVNPAFESIVGIKRENAVGKKASDMYGTGDAPYLETYADVARSGKPVNFETTFEPIGKSFRVAAFSPGKGKFATLFADITEHKKAQNALLESEERFRALFEQAAVGVAQIVTETGQFLRLNQKYCDILGYSREEMEAHTFQKITHPADLQADLDNMERLKQGHIREFSMEKRYYRKDNSIVWVNLTVSPMWRVGEEPYHHIAVVEDITERKKSQEKLTRYQERLRSLASELSLTEEHERRKMAGYLHDGPCQELAVCLLKLETLRASRETVNEGPVAEICQMIHRTVQDLRDLTFALSPPTLYLVGLEAAIEELLKEKLRNEHDILYDFKRANISRLLSDDLRALLFQSVRELLNNIVKYANPQKVTVTTCREDRSVKVMVADDGIGFDIDTIGSAVSKTGGYGLFNMGERIAYVGGQLEIWSHPGQGSQFTITVPLEVQEALV